VFILSLFFSGAKTYNKLKKTNIDEITTVFGFITGFLQVFLFPIVLMSVFTVSETQLLKMILIGIISFQLGIGILTLCLIKKKVNGINTKKRKEIKKESSKKTKIGNTTDYTPNIKDVNINKKKEEPILVLKNERDFSVISDISPLNNESESSESEEESTDDLTTQENESNQIPTVSELVRSKTAMKTWAKQKGDSFFKTNKTRFLVFDNNYFYWCLSKNVSYPNGAINLKSSDVKVTRESNNLKVATKFKERIFKFSDSKTASKWKRAMCKVGEENSSDE